MSNLSELLPSGGGQNQVEFVASGTLPNGKPVILNSNGTVTVVAAGTTSISQNIPSIAGTVFTGYSTAMSVSFDPNNSGKFVIAVRNASNQGVAIVGTISGSSVTFGSGVVFNSGSTALPAVSFDPNNSDKFVIAYQNEGGSNYGTAIAGSVSGTSLSFGSAVVFNSANTYYPTVSFDPNTSGKFVIAYKDTGGSNYGRAVVGTISGTSLTFGSEYAFSEGSTTFPVMAFDPNTANKFVVAYRYNGNSYKGTARVGSVSGTSISFGTEVIFNTSGQSTELAIDFDTINSGKFAIAYKDSGNSSYGTAIAGTRSGTSLSFGTEVVYNSGTSYYNSLAFNPLDGGKFVVTYSDSSNSSRGEARVGTISGTSISFATEAVFNTGGTYFTSVAADPINSGQFIVVYPDNDNSGNGTATVGQMAATTITTNLTSTNLIGIAAEAASSGATAKINIWGGINEAQSSLTIASDYYVQTDGTITTATGGQKVGQAISATTINMRNQP